ncbi:hypothetical protein GGS20DRAFT_385799 [Poronia punctata]|nr:hypothetical protein GGS20DRAFT_385799 [Poronia punctata]
MVAGQEVGAQRRRKVLNTYGKAPRKRVPKATFAPPTASESVSEEDPITASDTIVPRRQDQPRHRSKVASSSTRTQDEDELYNIQTVHALGPDRKRKASQIYTSKKPSRPSANEPEEKQQQEEESHPAAPEPRRARIAPSKKPSAVRSIDRERSDDELASTHSTRIETQSRLSSPPPTPTPPRTSRPRIESPRNFKQKPTSTLPTKGGQQRTAREQRHQIALHIARSPTQESNQTTSQSTKEVKKQIQFVPAEAPIASLPKKPRKRLIDALVEQDPSDATAPNEDVPNVQPSASQAAFSQTSSVAELNKQVLPATPKAKVRPGPSTGGRTFARSSSALKFTYGQDRKVREEEDNLLESLALPETSSYTRRRLDPEGPKKSFALGPAGYDDDDAATTSPSSKLRDIHELRQAGANSRVADAMQDLIDQIGKPGTSSSSSRRAALLQVAEKMQDKTFIRQCRDHGVESALLKDIANESDIICAYLILSSLLTILAKGPSAHTGQLLRTEETGPVFGRMLRIGDDIKKLVKDRKTNLSKRSQSSVIAVETHLRELPIWDGNPPSFVSPRGLGVKCLQVFLAQDILVDMRPSVFTEAVTKHLYDVLSDASNDAAYWDYPASPRSLELYGALTVLDFHAISMAASHGDNGEWAGKYLPIVADAFSTSLRTSSDDKRTLEGLVLKLIINLTNNNLAAPRVFADKGLLPALAAPISSSFDRALALVSQDSWAEWVLNGLVLRLGILINFAEHSDLVRQIVSDCRYENQEPVAELIRLFIENHRRTGEADSIKKTHLNVAFGYLSVLLGYLALYSPARQRFISSHPARSIGPLIGSIREFIAHYEQVENAMTEDDGDDETRGPGSYVKQLQELVQQLEDGAIHD